jgi:hypothetical protein
VRGAKNIAHKKTTEVILPWTGVLQNKVFVREFVSIDRLSTSAVMVGEIPTLTHEIGNDAVKGASSVSKSLFASAQRTEVLGSLGYDIGAQFHDYTASILATDGDIEVNFGVGPVCGDIVKKIILA